MYKLRKIYICDYCGKIALPEVWTDGLDWYKRTPKGWVALTKNEHLCPECAEAYMKFRLEGENR